MEISFKEWLWLPCLPEEVLGDEYSGFYLGILKVKEKIKFMEDAFNVSINYSNFNHRLFNSTDKRTFATGSLELEIIYPDPYHPHTKKNLFKKLIGAYTFNILDYDNDSDRNEQYAGTLKSLCTLNALMGEYPQFGSLLNRKELVRTIQGKKPSFRTSNSVKDTLNNLPK